MNHSQRNLKKLIRAKEDSIADEELFLSAAYQKYQTSLARAVTGRYRYGLQVLLGLGLPNRQALHIPTIIRYISTQRPDHPVFPHPFLTFPEPDRAHRA